MWLARYLQRTRAHTPAHTRPRTHARSNFHSGMLFATHLPAPSPILIHSPVPVHARDTLSIVPSQLRCGAVCSLLTTIHILTPYATVTYDCTLANTHIPLFTLVSRTQRRQQAYHLRLSTASLIHCLLACVLYRFNRNATRRDSNVR